MKKLLVLSVLLGLMALPMFASDFSFGGDVTFGFIGDFGDTIGEKTDLTFDIKAAIDDYNSLVINLDSLESGSALPSKGLVTTDVGKWLDLPVGVKVNWGWDDPDANEFEVISNYENEAVFDFSPGEYWGLDFLISWNFLELEVAFNPGIESAVPAAAYDLGKLLIGVAAKEPIPGLNAEVYWFQGGNATEAAGLDAVLNTADDDPTLVTDFDRGQLGIDAAYSTEVAGIALKASAAFLSDMDDAAANAWAYGVGLKGGYGMFEVTAGLNGNETDALAGLSATAVVAPIELLDIYAGMWLDLQDAAAETLKEIDLGVNFHVGAVEAYLGYVVTEVGSGDNWNSPAGIADGGMYVKFDVNY